MFGIPVHAKDFLHNYLLIKTLGNIIYMHIYMHVDYFTEYNLLVFIVIVSFKYVAMTKVTCHMYLCMQIVPVVL